MNLKFRILAPFLVASGFLFVFSIAGLYYEEQEHIERDFLHDFEAVQKTYNELLSDHAQTLRTALEFLIVDENLKAAFLTGDRQALYEASRALFERFDNSRGVTHFYFHDDRRKVFLRVHKPDRYGDTINRFTALEAESSGGISWGVELGPLGTFTLRVVAPWRDGDRLLGYIELGEDIVHQTHELSDMFDAGIFVLVSKQYLNREDWEQGMAMLGREHNWDQLPDLVVPSQAGKGYPAEQLLDGAYIPSWSDPEHIKETSVEGRAFRFAVLPLKDAGHRVVGGMMVVRDMTVRVDETVKAIAFITLVAGSIGLGLFGLFYVTLGRVERQLESREARVLVETRARLALQEKHVEELERVALYDSLTGLPKRKLLDEKINETIAKSISGRRTFALILLDLDRLREVNDTLGHDVGDRLLKQIAVTLEQSMSEAAIIARLTGGEFSLLLPAADEKTAVEVTHKIQNLFKNSFQIDGTSLTVGVSIGIALYPQHGDDASTLIRRMDVAMHLAKRTNAGYTIYDSSHDPYTVRRLNLVSELRNAINGRELNLHYQPQLDAMTGELMGVEALARWYHPDHGFVEPIEFVALAENTGLIGPFTTWVLNEAVEQCRAWEDQGLKINVSINVSAHNLMDSSFPAKVAEALDRWQLPAARLILEVTESVFMLETDHSLAIMDELRKLGTKLSIDDFGTGYSSLVYLKKMPVHELKIDQNFVRDMMINENDASIVSSTVLLAHSLGLKIVAEGVETEEIWNSLRTLGCDVVQGYLFSKPLPPDELLPWLKAPARFAQPA